VTLSRSRRLVRHRTITLRNDGSRPRSTGGPATPCSSGTRPAPQSREHVGVRAGGRGAAEEGNGVGLSCRINRPRGAQAICEQVRMQWREIPRGFGHDVGGQRRSSLRSSPARRRRLRFATAPRLRRRFIVARRRRARESAVRQSSPHALLRFTPCDEAHYRRCERDRVPIVPARCRSARSMRV
jgi:hypothetical protein